MTGKPTLENFLETATLKFIASDGFNIKEDILIIKTSKLGFLTVFLQGMKLVGPMITLFLFIYRFRVQLHTIVFSLSFTYGTENYNPL